MGIQSVGDWVSQTSKFRILHSVEEDNLSPLDLKSLPCAKALNQNQTRNTYIARARGKPILEVKSSGLNAHHHRVGLLTSSFCLILDSSSVREWAFSLLAI